MKWFIWTLLRDVLKRKKTVDKVDYYPNEYETGNSKYER